MSTAGCQEGRPAYGHCGFTRSEGDAVRSSVRAMTGTDTKPPPRCAGCGDRIGVYEPLWIEDADGALVPASLLNLDDGQRARAIALWHLGCVVSNFPPTTIDSPA
jgi:hypothetical protein